MMIEHLYAKPDRGNSKTGIAYVYCDYRDQKDQSITNIIGSLTSQLLGHLVEQDLNTACKQIEEERYKEGTSPSLPCALRLLKFVSDMFEQTFICLDAIDELETKTQTLFMKSVKDIFDGLCTQDSLGIFLCFTARPHVKDLVTQVLGDIPQSLTITANDDDIRKYIVHQLDLDPHPQLINDDLRQQLLTKIPMNSQGMYV